MERLFKVVYFAGMGIETIERAPHERQRRRIPRVESRVSSASREEERMMLEHFGDAYRAYCARTGRIVPRLHA